MQIKELTIKNLKCFSEVKNTIRPITVVVGENNTGKTTFLSAYKFVHDLLCEDKLVNPLSIEDLLKKESYKYLGGSEYITKQQSNLDTVNIGAIFQVGAQDIWKVEYSIKNGKYCEKIVIHCLKDKIKINLKEDNRLECLINGQEVYNATTPASFSIHFFGIIALLNNELKTKLEKNKVLHSKVTNFIKFEKSGLLKNISCNLLDPIYLKPKVQYNPTEIKTTDQADILLQMAKMKKNNNWSKISEELQRFGKASKLFQSLDIDISDENNDKSPFSIKVTVDKLKSNITNVGYGVSQILPVLGHIFISDQKKHHTFLMQQPETHLHPRVEAEFATLMVNMINQYNKKYRFICETHSDYIIQRSRVEIKKKNLNPEDFLILYFELKNGTAKIYPITVDHNGNMENQPDSYKEFFLSEDYELLGLNSE